MSDRWVLFRDGKHVETFASELGVRNYLRVRHDMPLEWALTNEGYTLIVESWLDRLARTNDPDRPRDELDFDFYSAEPPSEDDDY